MLDKLIREMFDVHFVYCIVCVFLIVFFYFLRAAISAVFSLVVPPCCISFVVGLFVF